MPQKDCDEVFYIPSADESPPSPTSHRLKKKAGEGSPLSRCAEDFMLLIRNFTLCPHVILPLKSATPLPGVIYKSPKVKFDFFLIGLLTLIEIPLLVGAIPAFLILPGWMFALGLVASGLIIKTISHFTWGPLVAHSNWTSNCTAKDFPGERWIFFNGIATSHAMLQQTCDAISATFGRPVVGVHNRSYGILADLAECLIQRTFRYQTQDVRVAAACLQEYLEDEGAKKVVVIAHSQGGLVTSLVLDKLYSILPADRFSKLEIYTFGSAASSFHNPLVSNSKALSEPATPSVTRVSTMSSIKTAPPASELAAPAKTSDRLIPVIEHYVNRRDLVPRWGVLHHVLLGTATTYSGRVFIHERTSGHLFDQHYLEPMLPVLRMKEVEEGEKDCFLNHVVSMSQQSHGIWRARTFGHQAEDDIGQSPEKASRDDEDKKEPATSSKAGAMEASRMTVKQLSRLWRYMGGQSP